jgi:DNA-binding MarR family transcriptional regulator
MRRRRSLVDARRRELQLTAAGLVVVEQVRSRIAQHEKRVQRLLSGLELQQLKRLLRRLQSLDSR